MFVVSKHAAGRSPVYNLTVDQDPEYFANGILVHNCLRYMVMRSPRQAMEQPSVSQYDRFMQIAKEIEGIPETEDGIIPMEDIIGNQAIW